MAFRCKVGSFVRQSASGTQTIVSGLDFTPKAIFIYSMANNTLNTWQNNAYFLNFFTSNVVAGSNSTNSIGYTASFKDAAATSVVYGTIIVNTPTISIQSAVSTTARVSSGDVTLTSSGFTINWATASESEIGQAYYGYILLGDSLSSTFVSNIAKRFVTLPAGNTTNYVDNTLVFAPKLIMSTFCGPSSLNNSADATIGLSAIDSFGSVATAAVSNDSGQAITTIKSNQSYKMPIIQGGFSGATQVVYRYSSLDSNGFTLLPHTCFNLGAGCLTHTYTYICLDIPNVVVGKFQKISSTVGNSQTIVTGFPPQAILFYNTGNSVLSDTLYSSTFTGNFSIGAADSTSQFSMLYTGDANVTTSKETRITRTDSAILKTNTTGTVQARANCTLNNDGFTVNWDVNDGNNEYIFYVAFPYSYQQLTQLAPVDISSDLPTDHKTYIRPLKITQTSTPDIYIETPNHTMYRSNDQGGTYEEIVIEPVYSFDLNAEPLHSFKTLASPVYELDYESHSGTKDLENL